MKRFLLRAPLIFALIISCTTFAQKKGKVPPYEPVSGVAQADVAALIFASLEELNNSSSAALSKEDIRLEEIDMANGRYKTNYINYVAMMMHRRIKANYAFKNGAIEITLSDIAVQNQTNGGQWEDSKMAMKGDKKILSKLAFKIKELNSDPAKVEAARKAFYTDLANVYEIMQNGASSDFKTQEALLQKGVTSIGPGLKVVDADLNNTGNGRGKFMVTYMYTAPENIRKNGMTELNFVQYTDSKKATGLTKGAAISSIAGCMVTQVKSTGEIAFTADDIKVRGIDFNQLVDTEPIAGIAVEDAFPLIQSVLETEGIEVSGFNLGDQTITSSWIDIKDGKLGGEKHALLKFRYDENHINLYYIQIMDSNNKNSSCLSKSCIEYKAGLSEKISALNQSADLTAMRQGFYENPKMNAIVLEGKNATTLMKQMWKEMAE